MSIKLMTWVFDDGPYEGKAQVIHLILADHANDDGVCWPSQATIARRARCSVEYVRRVVKQMQQDGWLEIVVASTREGKANTYRLTTSPTQLGTFTQGGKPSELGTLPNSSPPTSPTLVPSNHHESPVNPQEQSTVIAPLLRLPEGDPATRIFEVFWDVYPRHTGGKPGARRAWNRAIKVAAPTLIIDAAVRFRDDPNRLDEFTPHPTTWLNQHRWDDDPLPARGGPESGTRLYMDAADRLPHPSTLAIDALREMTP